MDVMRVRLSLFVLGFAAASGSLAQAQQYGQGQNGGNQQNQGNQQNGGNQQQDQSWSYSLSPRLYVDGYTGHGGPDGHQFSEFLRLGAERDNIWYNGDSFAVKAQIGAIQSHVENGGDSHNVHATPSDTTLDFYYTNFDNKTHGIETEVYFNLPTGNTDLNRRQSNAAPNEDVVSHLVGSEGFNGGIDLNYHWQADTWHYFVGAGYLYRGDQQRSNQNVGGGHEISARLGTDKQLSKQTNLGLKVEYSQLADISNRSGGNLDVNVPLTTEFDGTTVEFNYELSVSTKTDLLTEFRRDTGAFAPDRNSDYYDESGRYFRGTHHTLGVNVSHDLSKRVALTAMAEGSLGHTPTPSDPTYFPTKSRYTFGVGAITKLSDAWKFEAQARFLQVWGRNSGGGTTRFTGEAAFASLKYSF